jgi:hypothetical protein
MVDNEIRRGLHISCPKCGQDGIVFVYKKRGKEYFKVFHKIGKSGKPTSCYLGPVSKFPELREAYEKRKLKAELIRSSLEAGIKIASLGGPIEEPRGEEIRIGEDEFRAFITYYARRRGMKKEEEREKAKNLFKRIFYSGGIKRIILDEEIVKKVLGKEGG